MDLAKGGEERPYGSGTLENPDGISSYKQRMERRRRGSQIKALPWSPCDGGVLPSQFIFVWVHVTVGEKTRESFSGELPLSEVEHSWSEWRGSLGSVVIKF